MKNIRQYALLLIFLLISGAYVNKVFGWGSAGGDGQHYQQIQETAVFFNNSGASLTLGDVVLLDTAGVGVSTGTTLGSYVVPNNPVLPGVNVVLDSVMAVGVVRHTCADQRPCVIVTKGPALTTCNDSSDAVANKTAVGTSLLQTWGRCGGGTNLGIAMEAGDGTDGDQLIIWVAPTGAD